MHEAFEPDYSFEPYLRSLSLNWFDDDELLGRLLARYAGPQGHDATELSSWGVRVAGRLRELAEASAESTGLPRILHRNAYGGRVDRVVLPPATHEALSEVAGRQSLGAPHGNRYAFYTKGYLYGQNGEAGVVCSLGCTDGMVRALEALGEGDVHRQAVERIRGSTPDAVWHGAQFVTEAQGGSDVPANRTEAVQDGGGWRLHGRKWFCSNVNADYFLVTARPRDRADLALFLVPAFTEESLPSDGGPGGGVVEPGGTPRGGPRNGHTVDRLKDKLGTRELATAEVTFTGAAAHPVGPLDRGLAHLVRYVLTPSRIYCVQNAASTLRQAERIAGAYTEFRTAFGRPVADFPLARERLEAIGRARRRALAAYFELIRLWEASTRDDEAALDFRVLLSLAKPVLTSTSTHLAREAMNLLGANGIEERFSPLPRLYRDAAIMEIWEGPHDVLLTQALRDLVRFDVDGREFVERVLGEGSEAGRLADDLRDLLQRTREGDEGATVPFRDLAPRLVGAWADGLLDLSA